MNIKINKDNISGLLFVFYFCNAAFYSAFIRIVGRALAEPLFCVLFFTLFLLSLKYYRDIVVPLQIYGWVAFLIIITYFFHPEYNSWFSHPVYGINQAFLNPRAAIWAFLVVWLVKDDQKLHDYLKVTVWILFVYYLLQFISAMGRGYWVIYDVDGTVQHLSYSMEFGYYMLFPTAFFGAYAFLERKTFYYIPFCIGILAILLGGSRGALIWPIMMFPLMLPFKWKSLTSKKKIAFSMLILVLIITAYFIYEYFELIIAGISLFFSKYGFSSRSLTSLLSGAFSDANGRDRIYEMAVELIKTGGLFGRGVYGDRYYIGNYFRWGYSHNIFLEMLVSFGYLGGGIICILIIIGVINLFRYSKSIENQTIIITFFVTSLKLILSNSFWYTPSFWVLLALLIRSRNRRRISLNLKNV